MTDKTFTPKQLKLIEKYRDFNVEHIDWWESAYYNFREDMKVKHIEVDDIRFSGFWSQGDGASFTGYIRDNARFFEDHDLGKEYPWITKLMGMGGDFTLKIERTSHHYVHENTIGVDLIFTTLFSHIIEQRDDLRSAIADRWDQHLDEEYASICGVVTGIVRDYCRELYKQLEEEYNYLTSDEAVWEAIEANELDLETEDEEEEV
jgi:hypothetical protein